MTITEEQALEKWCFATRFSDEGIDAYSMSNRGEVVHRDVEPKLLTRCIGSRCMAWREIAESVVILNDGTEVLRGQTYHKGDIAKLTLRVIGGYCGLAGKP